MADKITILCDHNSRILIMFKGIRDIHFICSFLRHNRSVWIKSRAFQDPASIQPTIVKGQLVLLGKIDHWVLYTEEGVIY